MPTATINCVRFRKLTCGTPEHEYSDDSDDSDVSEDSNDDVSFPEHLLMTITNAKQDPFLKATQNYNGAMTTSEDGESPSETIYPALVHDLVLAAAPNLETLSLPSTREDKFSTAGFETATCTVKYR